jgi:very-short-patch-repair endonuclease
MAKSSYNKKLKGFARNLRRHGTLGEAVLWQEVLRARKFYGLQFNRQFPIENFIVDFACRKAKLIIEVDGSSHQHKVEEDRARDEVLKKLGFRVIRLSEGEVLNDLNNVIRTIEAFLPEDLIGGQSP